MYLSGYTWCWDRNHRKIDLPTTHPDIHNDIDILADDMSTKTRYMDHAVTQPQPTPWMYADGTGDPATAHTGDWLSRGYLIHHNLRNIPDSQTFRSLM